MSGGIINTIRHLVGTKKLQTEKEVKYDKKIYFIRIRFGEKSDAIKRKMYTKTFTIIVF